MQFAEHYAQVDLRALLAWLATQEMNEVLLETGPTLAGAALTAGLIDEIILYIAPHLMGDGARGCSGSRAWSTWSTASRCGSPRCGASGLICG